MLLPPPLSAGSDPHPSRARVAGTVWTTIAALAVVIAAIGLAVPPIGRAMLRHEGVALALGAIAGAAVWLFLVRGVARPWSVWMKGVLAITLLIWVFVGIDLVCEVKRTQERADLFTMSRITISPDGIPLMPPDMAGGPITRATMAFMRYAAGRDLARRAAYARLGFVRLDPLSERADPTLFTDCGRFARAKPAINAIDDTALDAIAAFRVRLGELIDDPGDRTAFITNFDSRYGGALTHRLRRRQLVEHSLEQTSVICTLLARRHWRLEAKGWRFTSDADQADFFRLRAAIERDREEMATFTPPSTYKTPSPSPKL